MVLLEMEVPVAVLEARPDVAKKKGRPKTGTNNVPVKIDDGLLQQAKMIALSESIPVSDYLNRILAPAIKKDLDRVERKIAQLKGQKDS